MCNVRNILLVALCISNQFLVSAQCPEAGELIRFLDRKPKNNDDYLQRLFQYELALNDCAPKIDSLECRLFYEISLDLGERKKYSEAIKYSNKAISSYRRSQYSQNTRKINLADIYFSMQAFYDSLGLKSMHMEFIDSCIQIEKNLNEAYKYSSKLISRKVFWLFTKGDFTQSIKLADYGESIVRNKNQSGDSLRTMAFLLAYKVQCLFSVGRLEEAEQILKNRLWPCVKEGVPGYIGLVHGISAELYNRKGNSKLEAQENWNSFYLNKQHNYPKGCAESLISIASMDIEDFGKKIDAERHLKDALKYADRIDSIRVYNLLANIKIMSGQFASGLKNFDHAFQLVGPGMREEDLMKLTIDQTATTHLNIYLSQLIIDKASAVLKQFKVTGNRKFLSESIRICRSADDFLTRIKEGIFQIESNLSWRRSTRKLYEIAIESSYFLNDNNAAFYFFERSRAVLLDDKIERERGMTIEELITNGTLKLEEKNLILKLQPLEQRSADYLSLQEKLYANQKEQEQLIGIVNKRRAASGFVSISTIELAQKKLLSNHEALIEIYSGDTSVYILKILKSQSELLRVNSSEYANLSATFNDALTKLSLSAKTQNANNQIAFKLFQLIFRSIPIPAGRIIVSPDGYYFPFEALVMSYSDRHTQYLLEKYAVSYTYSARYLSNYNFDVAKTNIDHFMGMAPVNFSRNHNLNTLLGSDKSLQLIGSDFKRPKIFINDSATKSNFLSNFYRYNIIHLYAHASAGTGDANPVLYFADSALYLDDIYALERPKTSMVVLAACETGLGKLYMGEGVFSFNRAFASLGIPAAIVNLWPVDNVTTYALSELFYAYISKGMDIDVAMQRAKLDYFQTASAEKKLPFYWAASIVTGRSANLIAPPSNTGLWSYFVAATIGCILIFGLVWSKANYSSKCLG